MGTTWFRTGTVSNLWDASWFQLCAVPPGSTLRRIRWSWGWAGVTADVVDVGRIMSNTLVAGLVTTVGNGSETPPNPAVASGDAAPPTQRWLWWEIRQSIATAVDHGSGMITWRDSGPQEIPDVKTQVLATGLPVGDTLNLWFRWQSTPFVAWDPSGSANVWVGSSVLYTTP